MAFPEDQLELPLRGGTTATNEQIVGVNIGDAIGSRYTILSFIGKGGMGIACKAMDQQLKQLVVLKFLLPHRFLNTRDISRFRREAKTASVLSHPGIVSVLDFATLANGQPYLAMEFLDGYTLAQRIETEGQLATEETIDLFIQICDALVYAHSKGILHRDIKPSNIMVTTSNGVAQAKLLDFGMAKFIDGEERHAQQITQANELIGSPFYMSPEQARNTNVDARSDLYSLGCTIYEALTGGPPHLGQTSLATILKRETDEPMALSEASFGKRFCDPLEDLVSKLLRTNPNERFQSAAEVKEELERIKSAGVATTKPPISSSAKNTGEVKDKRNLQYAILLAACLLTLFVLMQLLSKPEPHQPTKQVKAEIEVPASDFFDHAGMTALEQRYRAVDLHKMGTTYLLANQLPEALSAYTECIAIYERDPNCPKDKFAEALSGTAYTYYFLGDAEKSAFTLKKAISMYEQIHGKDSHDLAFILTSMGCTFLQRSTNANLAFQQMTKHLFERSLSIQSRLQNDASYDLQSLMGEQGIACLARGLESEASWRLERAAKLFRSEHNISADSLCFFTRTLCALVDLCSRTKQYNRIPILSRELVSAYTGLPLEKRRIVWPEVAHVADISRMCAKQQNAFRQTERLYEALIADYPDSPYHSKQQLVQLYRNLATACSAQSNPNDLERADHWQQQANLVLQGVSGTKSVITHPGK